MSEYDRSAADHIFAVPRGGAGLNIPCAYTDPPPTLVEGETATWAELGAAGFVRPGRGPVIVDAAGNEQECVYFVLRDAGGAIVATWDEGRWWTPDESAAFMAALLNGGGPE